MKATFQLAAILACTITLAGCRLFTPFPASPLELDFTFPAADIFEDLGELVGTVVLADGNTVALLTSEAELLLATFDGRLLDRRQLSLPEGQSGLGLFPNGDLLIADRSGVLHRYVLAQDQLSSYFTLPSRAEIDAVAIDDAGILYALVSKEAAMYLVSPDSSLRKTRIDPRFARYRITGLDSIGDFLLATGNDRINPSAPPLAIAFEQNGHFTKAWEIGGSPTAVVVLEPSLEPPELLTANADGNLLLWALPPQPGELDAPPLDYVSQFELGEEVGAQPSGIDFNTNDGDLYLVTDFARVLKTSTDGTITKSLFDLDALQGTFEAITLNTAGNIEVLASDESASAATLFEYDVSGVLLAENALDAGGEVVQAYAVDVNTGIKVWVTAEAGVTKKLFIQQPGEALVTQELPEEYTAFTITGIDLVDDDVLLLTDVREANESNLAGLLLIWDAEDADEIARFAVSRPGDDGSEVGVINPSDLTLAPNGILYVTADVNDGTVYQYDLSALLD